MMAFTLVILLSGAAALALWVLQKARIRVPELRAAVLWNRRRQALGRVLVGPGTYWILPGVEQVWGWLDLQPHILVGVTREIAPANGVPVEVEWHAIFRIRPSHIPPEDRPEILRALLKDPEGLIRTRMEHILRVRAGAKRIEDLLTGSGQQRLSDEALTELRRRLLPSGIEIRHVLVRAIRPPQEYQRARIQAQALHTVREALQQFTDADLQRVLNLERVRILGAEEGFMILPLPRADPERSSAEQQAA